MVEIIPKQIREVAREQKLIFYVLIGLAVLLLLTYLVLGLFQGRSERYLQSLKDEALAERTPEIVVLENEVADYKQKIDSFSPFLESHILNSKLFEFLEDKAHPRIYFPEISIDSVSPKVGLTGRADSFLSLGQQLIIFSEDPMVKNVSLSTLSLNRAGGVNFHISLSMDEEILRY